MDPTKISELLFAERNVFHGAVRAAIENTVARRNELKSQFAETLVTAATEISEVDFASALGILQTVSEDFNGILCQAGFSRETVSGWLDGKSTPTASFRAPLLQMFVTATLDDYANVSPLHELHRIVEECGRDISSIVSNRGLPLSQELEKLGFMGGLSSRTANCIKNEGFVMLGELLARSEQEMLRIPNYGRKSLNELNEALMARFGVRIGSLSVVEAQRYEWMTQNRQYLNGAARQAVTSQWSTDKLKPEYKTLTWDARRAKEAEGVEVYEQVKADSELMEALK